MQTRSDKLYFGVKLEKLTGPPQILKVRFFKISLWIYLETL